LVTHHKEDPQDVWIVFIHIPHTGIAAPCHSVLNLARQVGFDAELLKSEYVFDSEIKEEYVEHGVSLQPLINTDIGRYINLQLAHTWPL
jgi:hypothetical protein